MIITISGEAGSGKSSTAKLLALRYKLKHYSTGDLQRDIAKEKGLSINELGQIEEKDSSIDKMVDDRTTKLGETEDSFIMDSWLASFFIPKAIKIFLTADIDERVSRRLKQKRDTESFEEHTVAKEALLEREATNRRRWISLYGFDYKSEENYDLVVDTTDISIEKVVEKIINYLKSKQLVQE
ncbi:cytidylate kinase family protein [Candidatus Woesearchaeota archaeon]|nr:cytidylate kinase family protein [Candidatus Woesearchaeota archaeon]